MPSTVIRFSIFNIQILVLWSAVVALAVISSVAIISSTTRSDCSDINIGHNLVQAAAYINNVTTTAHVCTARERISSAVYRHASYIQSTHITIVQTIAAFSLSVATPFMWATTWSTLEGQNSQKNRQATVMTINALQHTVEMVSSPGVLSAVQYTIASRHNSPTLPFIVLLFSLLSIFSPIAISPIYKAHTGPYSVNATIVVGGGVGGNAYPSFHTDDSLNAGMAAGRSLMNAATVLNASIFPSVSNISIAPFVPEASTRSICSSAPKRFASSHDLITLNSSYFLPDGTYTQRANISFAGQFSGYVVGNDQQISTVYLNASNMVGPGWVEAQTSVIFLAPNSTMEGAQMHITSPSSTSRISFINVLVCTSTTRLEISKCTIDQGVVTNCNPSQPSDPLPTALTSPTGGVEAYIYHPLDVSTLLSAAAVTAYYHVDTRLPTYYQLTDDLVSTGLPPLSFLTWDDNTGFSPSIPLSYVNDILFGRAAQALVQGMLTEHQVLATQPMQLIATFGLSLPVLTGIIFALATASALGATLISTIPKMAREAVPLDLPRLIAISMNPGLGDLFSEYTDRKAKIDEKLLSKRVTYRSTWGLSLICEDDVDTTTINSA